jgi:hypothetical protein
MVRVLVGVGVFVGVDVKVAITQPVEVAGMVWVAAITGVLAPPMGVAVQVGGKDFRVGVLDGSTIRAGMVGGGKGLREELGFTPIWMKTTTRTSSAANPRTDRISQMEIFITPSRKSSQNCLFCQYIRLLSTVKKRLFIAVGGVEGRHA